MKRAEAMAGEMGPAELPVTLSETSPPDDVHSVHWSLSGDFTRL